MDTVFSTDVEETGLRDVVLPSDAHMLADDEKKKTCGSLNAWLAETAETKSRKCIEQTTVFEVFMARFSVAAVFLETTWIDGWQFGEQHGWNFDVEAARIEFVQIVKDEKPHDIVMSLPGGQLST